MKFIVKMSSFDKKLKSIVANVAIYFYNNIILLLLSFNHLLFPGNIKFHLNYIPFTLITESLLLKF